MRVHLLQWVSVRFLSVPTRLDPRRSGARRTGASEGHIGRAAGRSSARYKRLPAATLACALCLAGTHPGNAADCYRVTTGEWSPTVAARLRPYAELPREVRLGDEVGRTGPELGRRRARPLIRPDQGEAWAYWSLDDDLEVVFLHGAGVVRLRLSRRPWGWIGDAVARIGAPTESVHRAQVRLQPVPCS